ncbi:MAG TPA: SLC13 family permease, partial [Candidatus Omnitrophota bacterium]|nr:SLC13 family permease [Candidatus Omnitrophota bacterium]
MEIAITLTILIFIFVALALNLASADFVLFGSLAVLILTGILTAEEAFRGFSNTGMLTVALLFIVSAAIQVSGNLDILVTRFLGLSRRGGLSVLLLRMMAPIAFISAFINNTPIVVIFTPVIKKWTEKIHLSASKFLIPLSYATVLGGTCTLIGTSTNLLVHGLLLENGFQGYSLFELAWVGIPCAVVGLIYLSIIGKNILPDRKDVRSQVEDNPREYVVEMSVQEGSSLSGKTIRQAGLRNLRGLYLMEIEREGISIGPVSSSEILKEKDRLIFVGMPSAVLDLQQTAGLVPAAHGMFEKDFIRMRTHFVEA